MSRCHSPPSVARISLPAGSGSSLGATRFRADRHLGRRARAGPGPPGRNPVSRAQLVQVLRGSGRNVPGRVAQAQVELGAVGLRHPPAVLDHLLGVGQEPAVDVLADEGAADEEQHQAGHQAHQEQRHHQPGADARPQDAAAPLEVELGQAARDDEQQGADGQHVGQAQGQQGPAAGGVDARFHLGRQEPVAAEDHPDQHAQADREIEAVQFGIALSLGGHDQGTASGSPREARA